MLNFTLYSGIHQTKINDCDDKLERVLKLIGETPRSQFFPLEFQRTTRISDDVSHPVQYGGWADPRDVNLCLKFVDENLTNFVD